MDNSSAKSDRPRYASLTAGLLARKGEAVPVAAAFSPGAMAQHLPAKRLAQEFRTHTEETLESEELPTAGSLEERTSFIEEALTEESRREPRFDPDLDLFGDEAQMDEKTGSLGLDALVDQAIESASRKGVSFPDPNRRPLFDFERQEQRGSGQEDSSCAAKKHEFVASIRNAAIAEGGGNAMQLDPRRYIKLQVAAMKLDVTKQELLTAAVDSFLDSLMEDVFAECSCMKKGLI